MLEGTLPTAILGIFTQKLVTWCSVGAYSQVRVQARRGLCGVASSEL